MFPNRQDKSKVKPISPLEGITASRMKEANEAKEQADVIAHDPTITKVFLKRKKKKTKTPKSILEANMLIQQHLEHHGAGTSEASLFGVAERNVTKMSLWELLLYETENQKTTNTLDQVEKDLLMEKRYGTVKPEAAATSIRKARHIEMRELVNRQKLQFASTGGQLAVPECFRSRLALWRQLRGGMREKFLRWEIMKIQMLHGIHRNGTVVDEGEGRKIEVPLNFATSIPTVIPDSFYIREHLLEHRIIQQELFRLWEEVSLRGGVNKTSYFALAKEIVSLLLVHLNDREIYQVIAMDAEVDLPDGGGFMTEPLFLRFISAVVLLWMETNNVSEALLIVRVLREIWLRKMDSLDMKFVTKFSRRDGLSQLIPVLTTVALQSDEKLLEFAAAQLTISVQLRFGMLQTGNQEMKFQIIHKLKKRQKTVIMYDEPGGIRCFYMLPKVEEVTRLNDAEELVQSDEETQQQAAEEAQSPKKETNGDENNITNMHSKSNRQQQQRGSILASQAEGSPPPQFGSALNSMFKKRTSVFLSSPLQEKNNEKSLDEENATTMSTKQVSNVSKIKKEMSVVNDMVEVVSEGSSTAAILKTGKGGETQPGEGRKIKKNRPPPMDMSEKIAQQEEEAKKKKGVNLLSQFCSSASLQAEEMRQRFAELQWQQKLEEKQRKQQKATHFSVMKSALKEQRNRAKKKKNKFGGFDESENDIDDDDDDDDVDENNIYNASSNPLDFMRRSGSRKKKNAGSTTDRPSSPDSVGRPTSPVSPHSPASPSSPFDSKNKKMNDVQKNDDYYDLLLDAEAQQAARRKKVIKQQRERKKNVFHNASLALASNIRRTEKRREGKDGGDEPPGLDIGEVPSQRQKNTPIQQLLCELQQKNDKRQFRQGNAEGTLALTTYASSTFPAILAAREREKYNKKKLYPGDYCLTSCSTKAGMNFVLQETQLKGKGKDDSVPLDDNDILRGVALNQMIMKGGPRASTSMN